MTDRKYKLLLSVGPMRTGLDQVRYVQNRSSGQMGLAVAQQAHRFGFEVRTLLGPVDSAIRAQFPGDIVAHYDTAASYGQALAKAFPDCDAFLSLAAVLDFELVAFEGKLDREALGDRLELAMRKVPDFAAWAGANKSPEQKVIAFAAEVGPLAAMQKRAMEKCLKKNADAIVLNPVGPGTGPESPTNELWVLVPHRPPVHVGTGQKAQLAAPLLQTLFPERC